MDHSHVSHLSVVLDLSPTQWHLSALPPPANTHPLALASFLAQLLAFLNSHLASKHENTLAVFAAFPAKSLMLYPDTQQSVQLVDANTYPPFKLVDETVVTRIAEQLDALDDSDDEAPVALVGAFAKALCHINRLCLPSSNATATKTRDPNIPPDPRILILSVSPDLSESYIPIMNSIFSAQKLKVTVDVCQVYGPDSVFLQQAAHLTGGSYICLERRDAFLQYLIMSFLPPPSIRKILAVPTQDKIDFRAACFCHKNIVDIGYVCSVCLSIFCQPVPVCSTCRTKFPMKTLQRLNSSRPNLPSRPFSTPLHSRAPSAAASPVNPATAASPALSNGAPRTSTNGSRH